jgi:hypothetical protein
MNFKKPLLLWSVPRRQDCMKSEMQNTTIRLTSEQLLGRRYIATFTAVMKEDQLVDPSIDVTLSF